MKIGKKVFSIIMAACLLFTVLGGSALATLQVEYSATYGTDVSGVTSKVTDVFGLMQTVGVIVGIIMILWAGFKYLTKGAGGKAEAKEQVIPIIIGAAVIMLAPTIAKMVFTTFQ